MSDETPPKKTFHRPNQKPRDTFMPPEATGKMKLHPVHMSVDELIEYRKTGVRPPVIIEPGMIETMAKSGNSVQTICYVLGISKETFYKNTAYLTEFQAGRGQVAHQVTVKLAALALEENNAAALMYLHKLWGGDIEPTININATVSARPLEQASTEDLIEVAVKNINESKDNQG